MYFQAYPGDNHSFSKDLFFGNLIHKNQFDSIRKMLSNAQKGINFPMETIMKIYPMLDTLSAEKSGFHAVIKLLTILYDLSLCDNYRSLASTSFAHIDENSDSRRVRKIHESLITIIRGNTVGKPCRYHRDDTWH